MNGYGTQISERLARPGGVCTSWNRKGDVFDFAIHNVFGVGTNPPKMLA